MLPSASILLTVIAAYAVNAAQKCAVTMPMEGTIWKTGEEVTIGWSGVEQDNIPSITLAQKYADGTYNDVAKLVTSVPAAPRKYSLRVPSNVVSSDDYVILLGEAQDFDCASGVLAIHNVGNVVPVDQVSSSVEPVGVGTTPLSKATSTQASAPAANTNNGEAHDASPKTRSATNPSSQPSHSKPVVDSMQTKGPSSSANGITPMCVWVTAICSVVVGSILDALL
ncbi:hypothetical protein O0I10_004730 [Lichtheimia ornata]|uniref:Yeast cell wall synthesis Kre9/Knh1-like N-terminal domain-containing protein n=1 Tax=Lichtheimia ornata TaxID=688661 RepID=A0AAD7V6V9_9FUNG|nr:uncharacterized protein O0I10_004730 [Lichtheimia ornata]KAJ8659370.1 hypothetical protein O0I10_004730 [Lichtheimia ornata]